MYRNSEEQLGVDLAVYLLFETEWSPHNCKYKGFGAKEQQNGFFFSEFRGESVAMMWEPKWRLEFGSSAGLKTTPRAASPCGS